VGVVIRPVRVDDAEAVAGLRRRDAVARGIFAYPSERVETTRAFIAGLAPSSHSFVALVEGRVVGQAGLHVRDGKARHSASLGIAVHDDFHGRGVGRALMQQLLDVADRWLGLMRVDLTVRDDNAPARRLYEKLGFVVEGTQRKAVFADGELRDLVMMARLRE
jgi:putative acetyltransferase